MHDELGTNSQVADTDEPSLFWQDLAEQHRSELAVRGADNFKRHVAFRHFTWRWHLRSLWRSEQARFLLTHTPPREVWRALREPMDLDDEAWSGVEWRRRDRRAYVVAVRLLWAYAERRGDPQVIGLPEPLLGSPLPVTFKGRLISQDLANAALEAAAIARALGGSSPDHILEVGAGYGRTAYALLNRFPEARYTIVDIEPALSLSRSYLSAHFPAGRLRFLGPGELEEVDPRSIDLAVSISSLQEMTAEQNRFYASQLDRVAGDGVVYLKQWREWSNPVDGTRFEFDRMPIPPGWSMRFRERCPVQTRFVQAAWEVP